MSPSLPVTDFKSMAICNLTSEAYNLDMVTLATVGNAHQPWKHCDPWSLLMLWYGCIGQKLTAVNTRYPLSMLHRVDSTRFESGWHGGYCISVKVKMEMTVGHFLLPSIQLELVQTYLPMFKYMSAKSTKSDSWGTSYFPKYTAKAGFKHVCSC